MNRDLIANIALAKAYAVRGWGEAVLLPQNTCHYALYLCWVIPGLRIRFVAEPCRFLDRQPRDVIELNVALPWHAPLFYAVVCDHAGGLYNADGYVGEAELRAHIKSQWRAELYDCMAASESVYETVIARTNYDVDAMQMQAAYSYYAKEARSNDPVA